MPSDAFIGNCRAFANPVSPDEILKNRGPCTTNGTPGSDVRTHAIDNSIATCSIDGGDPMAFEHDGAGNLKKDCNYLYDYDCENRLTRVRRPDGENPPVTVAEYGYNALGWRAKKAVSNSGSLNGTWRMIYNAAWQLLETRTVSAEVLVTFRQFVHAGAPSPWLGRGSGASMGGLTRASYIDDHVAMIDPAANWEGYYQFYHADALFNTMAMTDAAGQVTLNVTYEPYGAATNADGSAITPTPGMTPFMRQGIIRDGETGNDDNRHRWYGPAIGRWGQRLDETTANVLPPKIERNSYRPSDRSALQAGALITPMRAASAPRAGGNAPSGPPTPETCKKQPCQQTHSHRENVTVDRIEKSGALCFVYPNSAISSEVIQQMNQDTDESTCPETVGFLHCPCSPETRVTIGPTDTTFVVNTSRPGCTITVAGHMQLTVVVTYGKCQLQIMFVPVGGTPMPLPK